MISVVEPMAALAGTAAKGEALVELRGLTVDYGVGERHVRAVDGIDLSIRTGEVVGLAGESGCGKTTVANAIMQILRQPAYLAGGSILFQGEDLVGLKREQLRRYRWRNVSMVFQSAMNALNPVMRVGDQFVDMMHAHERISKRTALARAGELLEVVGIDRRRLRAYPHELSGGMRQRVIIAMALALEPELLIMDEPTTALDVVVQREILQQVQDLKRDLGFSVLFITHDLSLLVEFADRIAIMYAGEIVETAPSARLYANPLHPYTRGLMESFPPLTGPLRAARRHSGRTTRSRGSSGRLPLPSALPSVYPRRSRVSQADNRAAAAASGRARAFRRLPPRRGCVVNELALEVRNLTKHFPASTGLTRRGNVHAVDDVSFSLRRGAMTALVGESGSGKSTVARLVARLYDPTSGTILFGDHDVAQDRSRRSILRYRSQVQMIFQDPFGSLNPAKTILHHIERPLRIHEIVASDQIEERAHDLLRTVGLVPPEHIAKKYPHELSGGQQQRVAIARALAVEPVVLLADEPTSMLDVSIRIGILNLMLRLKEERRIAFLYVTHDLASARYVADDILVMYAGQVVEQGPIEDVLANPLHPYTQLLLSAVPDPGTHLELKRIELHRGQASAAVDPTAGCRFVSRCPIAIDVCSKVTPALVEARADQAARCHVNAPAPALVERIA